MHTKKIYVGYFLSILLMIVSLAVISAWLYIMHFNLSFTVTSSEEAQALRKDLHYIRINEFFMQFIYFSIILSFILAVISSFINKHNFKFFPQDGLVRKSRILVLCYIPFFFIFILFIILLTLSGG